MDYLLPYFLVLCGLFHYGSPIMCYECNSAINSLCNENVLPDSLKRNCSEHDRGVTHTLCRKIVQQLEHEINGHMPLSRLIRSCGWDDTKYKGACYHRSGYGGKQEVCSCTTDYCNGSAVATSSVALLATSAVVALQKLLCD